MHTVCPLGLHVGRKLYAVERSGALQVRRGVPWRRAEGDRH